MVPEKNIDGSTNFGGGEVDRNIRPRLKEFYRLSIPPLGSNDHDAYLYTLLLEGSFC